MRNRLGVLFVLIGVSGGCGGGSSGGGSSIDGGTPADDGSVDPGPLTLQEREALEAQLSYELELMNVSVSTSRALPTEHTVVIRPAYYGRYFTNDMLCTTDTDPMGCRSGTSTFELNTAFAEYTPAARYEYMWEGVVGSHSGTMSFALSPVPTYHVDRAFMPLDGLAEIRRHTETITVTSAGENAFMFVREGHKDFDLVFADNPVRMRHVDETTVLAMPFEGGASVMSLTYEATYTHLRPTAVTINATADMAGTVTGTVTRDGQTLATMTGAPYAREPMPLVFTWMGEPGVPPAECMFSCGTRSCGLETACGRDCGACSGEMVCSPLGMCETPEL